jgi:dUTPase
VGVGVGDGVAVGGVPVTVGVDETVGLMVPLVGVGVDVILVPVGVKVSVNGVIVAVTNPRVGLGVTLGVTAGNGVATSCNFKRAMVV